MVVNLGRGYPDTVLAEKFFVALLETFLVASLGGPIVVPPSDPREGVIGPLHTNTINKLGGETSPGGTACAGTRVRTMSVEYLTRVGIGQMVVCGDRRICSNEISCRDRRIFYSASFFKVDMRRSQLWFPFGHFSLDHRTCPDTEPSCRAVVVSVLSICSRFASGTRLRPDCCWQIL